MTVLSFRLRRLATKPAFWSVILAVLFAALLTYLSLERHANLRSTEDLALFDQMFWNLRNGKGLVTTLSGEEDLLFRHHFFGEHVAPVLYLVAWPAGLTRGPAALFIIQALAFGCSVIPLARWAGRLLKNDWAGFGVALFWLLLPALWLAVLYDWHMECLEPLFLFAFVLSLYEGRKSVWIWGALYAFCKEDAAIYLGAVALVMGWLAGQRRLGLLVALVALIYAFLAWFVIQPYFSPAGKNLLIGRLLTPLSCHGWENWIWQVWLDERRWLALLKHLVAFGFTPLLGGSALLPAVLAIGTAWLSVSFFQSRILMHYPFTVYPLLALSAVMGVGFVLRFLNDSAAPRFTLFVKRGLRAALIIVPIAGLTVTWLINWDSLWREVGVGGRGWRKTGEVINTLPEEGCWAALLQLVPHCARHDEITLIMSPLQADWLVVKLHGRSFTMPENEYRQWLAGLLDAGSNYGVYARPNDAVVVLRRDWAADWNAETLEELLLVMEEDDVEHAVGELKYDERALNGRAWAVYGAKRDFVWFGGYRNLPAGRFIARFRIAVTAPDNKPVARIEVVEEAGKNVRGVMEISGTDGDYVWKTMEVDISGRGMAECRCFKTGEGKILIDRVEWMPVEIKEEKEDFIKNFFSLPVS